MNIGDKMPDLLGKDADGKEVRLSDCPGSKTVLYFYPKDNTPGCSAEACSLRDNYKAFQDAGYRVIGVSVDSPESHKKFMSKYDLPFPLVADTDKTLVEKAGVWGEKTLAGRKYMGTIRTTFILSPEGVVEQIIGPKQIKTKIHGEQLLDMIGK